ncbi:hypothetical protein [Nannocystis bainbridge]|uniref:Uncharacterized protein n=1 Tax=Nannocystis bainbridge TaxID=2995303 RepID=A0ABT5DP55_9BACT|nr:hypothetical protein [Nannocystis bainbridge]MDC0715435.1 hypothetical protein [Nannocystis bainbridge]
MSARPSLFVCTALLAALLAPPASASTATTATRGSAQPAAKASPSPQRPAQARPATTTATPARPAAAASAGRQDMVKKPGDPPTAAHVRSGTAAPANGTTKPRADAVDGRGPATSKGTRTSTGAAGQRATSTGPATQRDASTGPASKQTAATASRDAGQRTASGGTAGKQAVMTDSRDPGQRTTSAANNRAGVIDGRDAAALRELYRRKPVRGDRQAETRTAARPAQGETAIRGAAPSDRAAETTAARPARGELHGATSEVERKKIDASAPGRPTPAVVTREPISPAPAPEPESVVAAKADSSDMVQKTGSKKSRRKAAQAEDELLAEASGPRPTAGSSCAAGLGAAPALQFDRTRASLREFSWADMAYFFETAADEAEPQSRQVSGAGVLATDEAIRRSGLPRRPLEAVAQAQAVDLLTERELVRIDKALAGASPAALGTLLRADSPTLRAHVWTWLATTPAGACALVKLDGREVEAAIHDRSVAVEHGEDLVFRPLGDYALAARSRLAAADPQAYDQLLRTLAVDAGLDPRVRATVAGLRVRRGHADSIEAGLRDPVAAIRGATAAAAIDRDRPRYEGRVLDHAADDPADLVTELIVGELLGGPDGKPQGELAQRRDERVMAALARWKGRGDPMSPLPVPSQPLRFQAPNKKMESAPAPAPAPMIAATPVEPAVVPEAPAPAQARPAAEESIEAPRPLAHTPTRREPEPAASGPQLPSVLDDPTGTSLRP